MGNETGEIVDFEDCLSILDSELEKRRGKWRLTAIAWMDYDDVCQKIRLHVFNKWHLWDQSRPLKPWLNTIISNQITNMIRNNYSSFCKPCSRCEFNMGGDFCAKYEKQSDVCPEYQKWSLSKKNAYEIKMPISIHDTTSSDRDAGFKQVTQIDVPETSMFINYDDIVEVLHKKIKEALTPLEWKVYECLYIQNMSESDTAVVMGYKTSEQNRSPGYKQIKKIKNKIISIAKKITPDFF